MIDTELTYGVSEKTASFSFDRGVAQVHVGEPPVHIVFDQIHAERGEVGAEVSFYGGSNGSVRRLLRTRLNMTSTRARQETAKHLSTRLAGLAWVDLLETACWKVADTYRQGRPSFPLWDAQPPPGGKLLLPPLLAANEPTMIFGDGGHAKSYLALALALSIHSGRPLVGGMKPTATLRTAYLDFEWHEWPHKERAQALWGNELPPPRSFEYVPCQSEGPLCHQVDRLQAIFQEKQIQYAVIDSVALACDGPPEEAQVALKFFQALNRLEVGSLLAAHVNRGGDTTKPFGSAFWHNSARMTWYAKRVQEEDSDELDIALSNRKANDGKRVAPIGLHFAFGTERTTITRSDLGGVPELATEIPIKLRIVATVRAMPLTIAELADQLDLDAAVIRKTVNRHEGTTFVKLDGDPYRVALRGPDPS